MKIAVLGAGNGAHAMSADLALAGHEIRMAELPEFADNIASVRVMGGIHLAGLAPMGGTPGFAKVAMATTNIAEAVDGAQLIMVVVPAYAQEAFMRELVGCAKTGQIVVFNPGRLGSLVFTKMLRDAGREGELIVGETATLFYACRMRGPGRVWLKAGKKKMFFSTIPAARNEEALKIINQVYPQFVATNNLFETALRLPATIMHPTTTLMNMSRIEQIGPYRNSYYDVTPSVGRIMDTLDAEKQTVERALGLPGRSLPEILSDFYGVPATNCYETVHACKNYGVQTAPDSMKFRYVTEDVPYGMVPVASLGELLDVPTPGFRTMIWLAGTANGEDYWKIGRTADKMGLAGMSRSQLLEYVK